MIPVLVFLLTLGHGRLPRRPHQRSACGDFLPEPGRRRERSEQMSGVSRSALGRCVVVEDGFESACILIQNENPFILQPTELFSDMG